MEIYTVEEVSEKLKVNKNYVYKLINNGFITAIKLGSYKITSESLEEFVRTYNGMDLTVPTSPEATKKLELTKDI